MCTWYYNVKFLTSVYENYATTKSQDKIMDYNIIKFSYGCMHNTSTHTERSNKNNTRQLTDKYMVESHE